MMAKDWKQLAGLQADAARKLIGGAPTPEERRTTAMSVLVQLRGLGVLVAAAGENLKLSNTGQVTEALRQRVREYKAELLVLLTVGSSAVTSDADGKPWAEPKPTSAYAWVGWARVNRPRRGKWHPAVYADTNEDCWERLLNQELGGDKCVLPQGEHPNVIVDQYTAYEFENTPGREKNPSGIPSEWEQPLPLSEMQVLELTEIVEREEMTNQENNDTESESMVGMP